MDEKYFLEYLKDPVKATVEHNVREINELFDHLVKAKWYGPDTRPSLKADNYFVNVYGKDTSPGPLEDLGQRFIVILSQNLPDSHHVVDKGVRQRFRMHTEFPDEYVREFFVGRIR